MYDSLTRKGAAVDLAPLRLDAILSSAHRDRSMLLAFLLAALVNAAKKLVPEFAVNERPRHPLAEPYRLLTEEERKAEVETPGRRWRPRWARRMEGGDESGDPDEGQGLAEYALILALIAIVAIVALIFLGDQIAAALSNVGVSV